MTSLPRRRWAVVHLREVRLAAVATRFLCDLTERTPLVRGTQSGGRVLVDLDDTIVPVHGKVSTGVRGLPWSVSR